MSEFLFVACQVLFTVSAYADWHYLDAVVNSIGARFVRKICQSACAGSDQRHSQVAVLFMERGVTGYQALSDQQ